MNDEKTRFSVFLGFRFSPKVIFIDKVDSACGIKVSPEVGMQMLILSGAGII